VSLLKRCLEHPLTRGLDVDDPATTRLRRRILENKPFLRRIYEEWYAAIERSLPSGGQPVLELGSGAGFLAEHVPGLIRSEVFLCGGGAVDAVLDGLALPLADRSLRAVAMTNVLHHLPHPRRFFAEAARCVVPGGVVSMIEPWNTPGSRWVYERLHHEPFLPAAPEWDPPAGGPLSGANGALPWILFARDREAFLREVPWWRIRSIEPMMPFRYLLSGGVSLRSLMPAWTHGLWRGVERAIDPRGERLAMFAHIVLERSRA
jgi:SAM-dependent methyltransferase